MLKLPQRQRALTRITLIVASILGMLLTAGSSGMAAGADLRPTASQTTAGSAAAQSKTIARSLPSDYAQRETAAKDLEQFSGGSAGIYIGGSTVAVVLLIVLVILIL